MSVLLSATVTCSSLTRMRFTSAILSYAALYEGTMKVSRRARGQPFTTSSELTNEPVASQAGNCLERAGLLEKVRGSGNDDELVFDSERLHRTAVERDHLSICP